MLYSCTRMATVGVKGLNDDDDHLSVCPSVSLSVCLSPDSCTKTTKPISVKIQDNVGTVKKHNVPHFLLLIQPLFF